MALAVTTDVLTKDIHNDLCKYRLETIMVKWVICTKGEAQDVLNSSIARQTESLVVGKVGTVETCSIINGWTCLCRAETVLITMSVAPWGFIR